MIKKYFLVIKNDFFLEMKKMRKIVFWVFLVQGLVLLLALVLGYERDNLDKHFGEDGFVTWFSFFNLLFTSYVFALVFYNTLRNSREENSSIKKSLIYSSVWLAIAIGFLWLSFDEILMLHEKTDKAFHKFFQIEETPLTNRIDDFMVFSYPILGMVILFLSRKGLYAYRKALYFLGIGVVFFFIMTVYDFMGKGLSSKYHNTRTLYQVYEESTKVLAEGFLIVSGLYCLGVSERVQSKKKRSKERNV